MWSRMSVDLSMERAALETEDLALAYLGREGRRIPHLLEHVVLWFAMTIQQVRLG